MKKKSYYYTVEKQSGMKLNSQKTDFNVKQHHFAKFNTENLAQKWIDDNSHNFLSVSKKPLKMQVKKYVVEKDVPYTFDNLSNDIQAALRITLTGKRSYN